MMKRLEVGDLTTVSVCSLCYFYLQHVFGNFAFLDAMCLGKSGRYVLDELLMVMSYPDILGPELMHEMDILLDTMRYVVYYV